uniref:hypothetical protein n=1 Tax=unclassified Paenarthrobacter TaxID=2634190 RepID=UPI0033939398
DSLNGGGFESDGPSKIRETSFSGPALWGARRAPLNLTDSAHKVTFTPRSRKAHTLSNCFIVGETAKINNR